MEEIRIYLNSSFLEAFEYNDEKMELTVIFKNGNEYTYVDVPPEVVEDFKNSDSQGKYYSANIKGSFEQG